MNLCFIIKQLAYCLVLISISLGGDFILGSEKVEKIVLLRCLIDNLTHVGLGVISWLIVVSYEKCSLVQLYQSLLCGLFASLIDIDHFLMARSFMLKDALSLSSRPPFHNTTLVALFVACFISAMYYKGREQLEKIGWYVLVAAVSHHLRDAQRRGLWLWPWVTKPLNFTHYVILSHAFPLAVGSLLKILNRSLPKVVDTLHV